LGFQVNVLVVHANNPLLMRSSSVSLSDSIVVNPSLSVLIRLKI